MSADDRLDNKVDQGSGKAKEFTGKITGDPELESEGRTQAKTAKTKDKLEKAGEEVAKAGRDLGAKIKGAFRR
jgi:uncharacterized protein YjbJ (UPF0337 family)